MAWKEIVNALRQLVAPLQNRLVHARTTTNTITVSVGAFKSVEKEE